MVQAWQSFVSMLAAIVMALGVGAQPDAMADLAGTQWVDHDGLVYSFNEDASLFACYETGFSYRRMTTGEYRQALITQDAEFIYELDERTFEFAMDGENLLLQYYRRDELIHSQLFTPYMPDNE